MGFCDVGGYSSKHGSRESEEEGRKREKCCSRLVLTCRKNRKNRGCSGPRSLGIFTMSVT